MAGAAKPAPASEETNKLNGLLVPVSKQAVTAILVNLKPSDVVICECFSETSGICMQKGYEGVIQTLLKGRGTRHVTFIRLKDEFALKGFIETLPIDTYPTYMFYKVSAAGGLERKSRFEPRDFGKTDLTCPYFGEAPVSMTLLLAALKRWIEETEATILKEAKEKEVVAAAPGEAGGSRYRMRPRTK